MENALFECRGAYSLGGKVVDEITSPVSYNTISVTGMSSGERIPTSENDLYVNH